MVAKKNESKKGEKKSKKDTVDVKAKVETVEKSLTKRIEKWTKAQEMHKAAIVKLEEKMNKARTYAATRITTIKQKGDPKSRLEVKIAKLVKKQKDLEAKLAEM